MEILFTLHLTLNGLSIMVAELVHESAPVLIADFDHAGLETVVLSGDTDRMSRLLEAFAKITTKLESGVHLLSFIIRITAAEYCQDKGCALSLVLDRDK